MIESFRSKVRGLERLLNEAKCANSFASVALHDNEVMASLGLLLEVVSEEKVAGDEGLLSARRLFLDPLLLSSALFTSWWFYQRNLKFASLLWCSKLT